MFEFCFHEQNDSNVVVVVLLVQNIINPGGNIE